MEQKYWLNIDPDTFIWMQNDRALMYNSRLDISFEYGCDVCTAELTRKLCDLDNLYTIEVSEREMQDSPSLKTWIETVVSRSMGRMVLQDETAVRPVSLPPCLNVGKDVNKPRSDPERTIGEGIMDYLHEMTFYLGGAGSRPERGYYRQMDYPVVHAETLDAADVTAFLEKCRGSALGAVTLVGDIFNRGGTEWASTLGDRYSIGVNVVMFYEDYEKARERGLSDEGLHFSLLCEPGQSLRKYGCKYIFPVASETEYEKAEETGAGLGECDYSVVPLFTGENTDFFERFVYSGAEDFVSPGVSRREIFAHQVLNTFFFGKLTVMPDRRVCAQVNMPPLGTTADSPARMIYQELDRGTTWRKIREDKPCTECLYRYLCPSPSGYELVMNRVNPCRMRE